MFDRRRGKWCGPKNYQQPDASGIYICGGCGYTPSLRYRAAEFILSLNERQKEELAAVLRTRSDDIARRTCTSVVCDWVEDHGGNRRLGKVLRLKEIAAVSE
jgi:hypothetical protein